MIQAERPEAHCDEFFQVELQVRRQERQLEADGRPVDDAATNPVESAKLPEEMAVMGGQKVGAFFGILQRRREPTNAKASDRVPRKALRQLVRQRL